MCNHVQVKVICSLLNVLWHPWEWGFPDGSVVKNTPLIHEMQEMQVQSVGLEDSLEEKTATQSSILA